MSNINQEPGGNIFALSPVIYNLYNANYTETNFQYILKVYIWSGDMSTPPGTETYTLRKYPNQHGAAAFDIGGLIRSQLSLQPYNTINTFTTDTIDAVNETRWVKVIGTYSSDGPSSPTSTGSNTRLALKGHTLHTEGVNGDNDNRSVLDLLTPLRYGNGARSTFSCLTGTIKSVAVVTDNFEVTIDLSAKTATESTEALVHVACGSDMFGEGGWGYIRKQWTNDGATIERESCQKDELNTEGTYTLSFKDVGGTALFTYTGTNECTGRFQTGSIGYLNRHGGVSYLPAHMAIKEGGRIERTTYQNKTGTLAQTGVSYDTSAPVYKVFNGSARRTLTFNTGFQPEAIKDMVEEMLMSECVWYFDGTTTTPLISTDNSPSYFREVDDRTINYTLNFDVAADRMNAVTI